MGRKAGVGEGRWQQEQKRVPGAQGFYKTEAKSKERAGSTRDERNGCLVSSCSWLLLAEHSLSELDMRKLRKFSFAVICCYLALDSLLCSLLTKPDDSKPRWTRTGWLPGKCG